MEQVMPLLGHQYKPLLEDPKPAPLIPCYNTQANAIKQFIMLSGKIVMCWEHYYVVWEAVCDLWWLPYWEAMATIKKDQS